MISRYTIIISNFGYLPVQTKAAVGRSNRVNNVTVDRLYLTNYEQRLQNLGSTLLYIQIQIQQKIH